MYYTVLVVVCVCFGLGWGLIVLVWGWVLAMWWVGCFGFVDEGFVVWVGVRCLFGFGVLCFCCVIVVDFVFVSLMLLWVGCFVGWVGFGMFDWLCV